MKRRATACALALLFAALLRGAIVYAAEPRVVVRVRSANGALDERFAAELSTLGFEVRDVEATDPDADLGAIARANGALAAVRASAENAIEIWVAAPHGLDPPIHEVIRDPRRGRNVVTVLALEALRAHLIAIKPEPSPAPTNPEPPPSPPSPPPPAAIAPSPPSDPRLWIHVAVGGEASPGGLSPAADLVVALRFEPRPWIALSVFGAWSPTSAQIGAVEGGASVRRSLAGCAFDLQARTGATTLSIGGGGALVFMAVRGQSPAAGYAGQDASLVTAGPLLRGGAAFAISSSFRLRTELTTGVTFPRATISFADREAAAWGRPFAMLTLGIEWGALR